MRKAGRLAARRLRFRIPDPMIGTNEAVVRWVAEAAWELGRTFTVDPVSLREKWPVLDLEFVDTNRHLRQSGVALL